MQKFTVELAVSLDRWNRVDLARKRRESGQTSIRVSKSTLAALRSFANRLVEAAAAGGGVDDWRLTAPAPDAILEALAAGSITVGHTAGRPAVPDVGKGMQKRDPAKHASKRSPKGIRKRSR